MQVILGVIYHFIGGFASGSFYIPYKKVRGWAWESYWITGGLFSAFNKKVLPFQISDPAVWEALLVKMPLTAMLRNLGVMAKIGLLTAMVGMGLALV